MFFIVFFFFALFCFLQCICSFVATSHNSSSYCVKLQFPNGAEAHCCTQRFCVSLKYCKCTTSNELHLNLPYLYTSKGVTDSKEDHTMCAGVKCITFMCTVSHSLLEILSVMKGSSTANMLSKVPLSNIIIRTRTDYISEDKVYIFLQN